MLLKKEVDLERKQARVTFSSNLRKWSKSGYWLSFLNDWIIWWRETCPRTPWPSFTAAPCWCPPIFFYSINENFYGFIANYCVLTSGHGKKNFFFLKGGILLHYCSHSTLEKCDPLTAEVTQRILFYKILKVRMSHQSTDSVANDPPGEPAWPRWTEKGGRRVAPCKNEVLHTVEQWEDSEAVPAFIPDAWSCLLKRQFFKMEIHPKWNGGPRMMQIGWKKCKENKFQCTKSHFVPLCWAIGVVPLWLGRVFKGAIAPRTVVMCSSVSCQCLPWRVITLASCFKP